MTESRLKSLAAIGRWTLMLLLAGLLIGRRDFAHLSLADLLRHLSLTPPSWSARAYITESTLLLLLPLALILATHQFSFATGSTRRARFLNAFGWGSVMALAFGAYGFAHAVIAKFSGGDNYLILRQSALAAYPIAFLYALIFFSGEKTFARNGAFAGIAAALLCALLDTFGWLGPVQVPETGEWMPIYGQETLPLAILGLGFLFISAPNHVIRALALAGMLFAGWRQGARPTQSVVPIGMAGALVILLLLSLLLALRGQRQTLKRVALLLAFFIALGLFYKALKPKSAAPEQPGTETASEVKAWDLSQYGRLFDLFDRTQRPDDYRNYMFSKRPPIVPVEDPEVYKLQAVFESTPSVSVRNNIWRFLVWRRMLLEWRTEKTTFGTGVGKPWFYEAMYHSGFHYGDPREGLDPHNSYINTLHRYGIVGLLLLLSIVVTVIWAALGALRISSGDITLEALMLYFFYTLIFAFFTVSLEGPAYSLPFWISLGLVSARTRSLRAHSAPISSSDPAPRP